MYGEFKTLRRKRGGLTVLKFSKINNFYTKRKPTKFAKLCFLKLGKLFFSSDFMTK